MDKSFKRKSQEQREAFQSSSSVRRKEDAKRRTKRESPKRAPKEASTRREPVNLRRIREARKKTPNNKDTSTKVSTSYNRSRPKDKEEAGTEEHLGDQREDLDWNKERLR